MIVRVGVDLSLTSPGVALFREDQPHQVWLLCFQQRKTDELFTDRPLQRDPRVLYLTRLRYPEVDRWSRMDHIVTQIVSWIADRCGGVVPQIHIENYAFGATHSSSVSSLAELGGAMRLAWHRKGWTWRDLAPSSVKKAFAGHGRADKPAMLQAYLVHGWPALGDVLKCQPHQSPLHDLVDALALAVTTPGPAVPKRRAVPKKRKRCIAAGTAGDHPHGLA